MKMHIPSLVFLFLAAVPCAGIAAEIACESVEKSADGSSSGHSAKLTLVDGRIVGLAVESFTASGEEGGAYACNLDTADGDTKSRWSVSGDTVKLDMVTMGEKSSVFVKRTKGSYLLDLEKVSRVYCGFGAEWPATLVISAASKHCLVK